VAARLRPMTADDGPGVLAVMRAAFTDLDRRHNRPPQPWADDDAGPLVRMRHLAATDPEGVWVAEAAGRVVGCAQAILREGIWGLSLFVVDPAHQGTGLGRQLMERALAYGAGARGGLILSSPDERAMAFYARAGFDLRPAVDLKGTVARPPAPPAAVREGRWPDDRPLVDGASRAVRTAAHGGDVGALIAAGGRLLVDDRGGFAVVRSGEVRLLAAAGEEVASDLLRAALATVAPGGPAAADFVAAGHDWAVAAGLEAGLELRVAGPIFTRGDVGPMRPYLPSGSYL